MKNTAKTSELNPRNTPNILWIGVDQMRVDSLGFYGQTICQTPNLDRFAESGISFSRAYTTCSLCSPSRASMYTGQFAFHHGMGTNCDMYHSMAAELPHPEDLLHYRLQEIGYRTGFTGKWHVGTKMGPGDYGFEGMNLPGYGDIRKTEAYQQHIKEKGLDVGPVKNPIFGNPDNQTLISGEWNGALESTPTYHLANRTMDLLEEFAGTYHSRKQPFFLTCQFWAPHGPHLPSPEYVGRHDRKKIKEWKNFNDSFEGKPNHLARYRRDFFQLLPYDWEGWREIVGLAYDFSTMLDDQIGRILQKLEALQLDEETIVIFTSDHGDMMGSHGGLYDKGFMYEEAHRVPLIIRIPGQGEKGGTLDQLVYNMDIMPTIFDIIGESPGPKVDAESFYSLIKNPQLPGRENLYMEFHGLRCLHTQRALVTANGLKYIFTPMDEDEVYDLNNDPHELVNVINQTAYQEQVLDIKRQLISAAMKAGDPVRDYISKLHGDWRNVSDQVDVSSAYTSL